MRPLIVIPKRIINVIVRLAIGVIAFGILPNANGGTPSQTPLFLAAPVRPIMMLNMSKEHQLFFKLYDDYSNITDANGGEPDAEGTPDLTYNNNYDYYGYFDSNKCYVYSNSRKRFRPADTRFEKYCNSGVTVNQWSGNFLNWASMTRIDAIRKILYGGLRSTDTAASSTTESVTILERAFLPNDAHSFAKYYNGSDISRLTPFTDNSSDGDLSHRGITICNTTEPENRSKLSQEDTGVLDVPLMRIAQGNYTFWASNERWQCRWDTSGNGNNVAITGVNANSNSPSKQNVGLGQKDYVVRVVVCDRDFLAATDTVDNEKCKAYGTAPSISYKPTGLLQAHGENDSIYFGLMTGSYGKNKSGGVLRKPAVSIKNEINAADGTFVVPSNGYSIIKTLDLLRIYGYRFDDGTYHSLTGTTALTSSDDCVWAMSSFNNGQCSNWGNPQAEIYLESLRYLAGQTTPNFDVDDSARIPGLNRVPTWTDPIDTSASGNYCAPLNVLQFNASTTSYDTDNLAGATTIDFTGNDSVNNATDAIGVAEGITGSYFVGENGGIGADDNNQFCNAKTVTALSSLKGICPESPRLEGGYKIAGLAYLARKKGIAANREKVKTFGVALAPAVPRVTVVVPGSNPQKTVTILPACRNLQPNPDANCALVDFKIVSQQVVNGNVVGRLYVNWEDSEQGGDFDQDMWGVINYTVSSSNVIISTDVVAQSSGDQMGFGYVVSGTTNDGFKVHSGMNGFTLAGTGCNNCQTGDAATSVTYDVGTSTAKSLESPLYYAAKWGGYKDDNATPAEIFATNPQDSVTGTYFFATDPHKLEQSLTNAFKKVAATVGSASTVAANSTNVQGTANIYQARFDSSNWSGELRAFSIDSSATISNDPVWSTDTTLTNVSARNIFTYDGATTKSLVKLTAGNWISALPDLKAALKLSSETDYSNAAKRFSWLMGSNEYESDTALRVRTRVLGDIINSDPAFVGTNSQRYNLLPSATGFGASSYLNYVKSKANRKSVIFVGANDGMLHAFDGTTGAELFAYIPRGVFQKLAELPSHTYTHKYFVDGPVYASDVFMTSDNSWHTIIAGTLGAGGRGVYALDVTDVLNIATPGDPRVIFDISADDAANTAQPNAALKDDLGYSMGRVLVLPTEGGNWTAMFANGTNSNNGYAKFIGIDINNPSTKYKVIDTKARISASNDNGLSPLAFLPAITNVVNIAYGGDLMGNMWKFDLANSDMNEWKVTYGTNAAPLPLIKVIDSLGNGQPIASAPTLGRNGLKTETDPAIMVYFGTGKYLESADNSLTSLQVQSMYAIADSGANIPLTAANRASTLHQKTISAQTTTSRTIIGDKNVGVTAAVPWANVNGWFLDLIPPSLTAKGERILSKPLLIYDRIILNTFIPSINQCEYGGSGWIMELTGVGGMYGEYSTLGNDGNNHNPNQFLNNPVLGDLVSVSLDPKKLVILGSSLGTGTGNGSGAGAGVTSQGMFKAPGEKAPGTYGRLSWRQLK